MVLYLNLYQRVITFFKFNLYFYSLINNGRWASVEKGQVIRVNNSFVIWAFVKDINFFQILEAQIDETMAMVPNSSIWAFSKSEIMRYAEFISLIRSKLADNVQRYKVVVCDPNMLSGSSN